MQINIQETKCLVIKPKNLSAPKTIRIQPNMASIDRTIIRIQKYKKETKIQIGKEGVIQCSGPVSVVESTLQCSPINFGMKDLYTMLKHSLQTFKTKNLMLVAGQKPLNIQKKLSKIVQEFSKRNLASRHSYPSSPCCI